MKVLLSPSVSQPAQVRALIGSVRELQAVPVTEAPSASMTIERAAPGRLCSEKVRLVSTSVLVTRAGDGAARARGHRLLEVDPTLAGDPGAVVVAQRADQLGAGQTVAFGDLVHLVAQRSQRVATVAVDVDDRVGALGGPGRRIGGPGCRTPTTRHRGRLRGLLERG